MKGGTIFCIFSCYPTGFPFICMPIIINDIGKKEINIS